MLIQPVNAFALAQYQKHKDFTTIKVRFRDDRGIGQHTHPYTYKAPKKWGCIPGTHVVVRVATGRFLVAEVVEAHEKPVITGQEDYRIEWAVCRVDEQEYTLRKGADDLFAQKYEQMKTEELLRLSLDFVGYGDTGVDKTTSGAAQQKRQRANAAKRKVASVKRVKRRGR